MSNKLIFGLSILLATSNPATSEEPKAANPSDPQSSWNKTAAGQYLDERAGAWYAFSGADRGTGPDKISCISCHGMLPFALARPALRKLTGTAQPTALESRLIEQTKSRVEHWPDLDSKKFRLSYDFSEEKKLQSWGTEAVLNSLILSFDDQYQGRKKASQATQKAFGNLWEVQIAEGENAGSWDWLDFGLEPWETKEARFFGATLAAIGIGTAPDYYSPGRDENLDKKITLLRGYLQAKWKSENLNNRIWMLWAAAKLDGLLTPEEKQTITNALWQKQQADGGWSLSSLEAKPRSGDFVPDTHSDGYATGFILHVLQTAGMDKKDRRIQHGLQWLRTHQSTTGAWTANSVNRMRDPTSHVGKFMSDAATAYAVLALSH